MVLCSDSIEKNPGDENENNRLLLQISYSRLEHLSNLLQQIMGFVIALIVAIIGLFLKDFPPVLIFLAISIILLSWRWYSRIIDKQIIQQYKKILYLEQLLKIPESVALITYLINVFPKNLRRQYEQLPIDERYDELIYLTNTNQVGHRHHNQYDFTFFLASWVTILIYIDGFNLASESIFFKVLLLIFFWIIWWAIENIFIRRNPPPLTEHNSSYNERAINYAQMILYTLWLLSSLFIAIILSRFLTPVILIIYFLIILVLGLYTYWGYKNPKNLIKSYPEKNSFFAHHAIIIAHKGLPNKNGNYPFSDYDGGIDILIKRFLDPKKPVNYKVYEIDSREEAIAIITDENAKYLWIFGHGRRNILALNKGLLFYYDVKHASKKTFIGQYHCNTLFGRSLVDYNQPEFFDISWWPRISPIIRFLVKRKIKKLLN